MANDLTGNLLVAQGPATPFSALNYGGGGWSCISAAGTPLVVIPTTLCIFEIFNNTGIAGPPAFMEIEDLLAFHLLGTAAVHNVSLWAEVTAPKAAPSLSAVVVGSSSGRAPYTSTAGTPVVTAAGTTVVSAGWQPFGNPNVSTTSTALPGEAWRASVDGKLTVPPGCSLAITCVDALATGSSVQVGAFWYWKAAANVANVA